MFEKVLKRIMMCSILKLHKLHILIMANSLKRKYKSYASMNELICLSNLENIEY